MAYGMCLKCLKLVEKDEVDESIYPVTHKDCHGEIAVLIDIGEAIRELLDPPPQWAQPELGPPPGQFAAMLGVRLATVEEIQVINTLYGGPFDNEGVECDCGERTKRSPCVHCGRPVDIEYVKPKPPRFCEGPSYVNVPADRSWERDDEG
jgi:hypothetical protein